MSGESITTRLQYNRTLPTAFLHTDLGVNDTEREAGQQEEGRHVHIGGGVDADVTVEEVVENRHVKGHQTPVRGARG